MILSKRILKTETIPFNTASAKAKLSRFSVPAWFGCRSILSWIPMSFRWRRKKEAAVWSLAGSTIMQTYFNRFVQFRLRQIHNHHQHRQIVNNSSSVPEETRPSFVAIKTNKTIRRNSTSNFLIFATIKTLAGQTLRRPTSKTSNTQSIIVEKPSLFDRSRFPVPRRQSDHLPIVSRELVSKHLLSNDRTHFKYLSLPIRDSSQSVLRSRAANTVIVGSAKSQKSEPVQRFQATQSFENKVPKIFAQTQSRRNVGQDLIEQRSQSKRFQFEHSEELIFRDNRQRTFEQKVSLPSGNDNREQATKSTGSKNASTVTMNQPAPVLKFSQIEPALLDRLTDNVIRKVEKQIRIERQRRGM